QRDFARLSIERAQSDLNKANVGLDRNKLTQYIQQMQAAKKSQDENAQKIKPLQDELDKLNADYYRIDTDLKNSKAIYGTDKYTLDESVATAMRDPKKQPEADKARKVLEEDEKKVSDLTAQREALSLKI